MPLDVVAVPRSRSVVLAAVVDEGDGVLLSLVAEDGARFRFPAQRALARTPLDADAGEVPVEQLLTRLRRGLEPFTDWLPLRATLEDDALLELPEVAVAAGLDEPRAALRVALGLPRAEPWFRREGARVRVVPMGEALKGLYRQHDDVFEAAGDAALRAWWPRRDDGVPDGWLDPAGEVGTASRVALERARFFDPDYTPDEVVAAAAALATLMEWALAGHVSDATRGRELARRLGLPEDPDHVLEALVDRGVLAADVEPAPRRAGLDAGFDDAALEQLRSVAAGPRDDAREDLTHEFTVAVDDADTREVDDALTLRRDGDVLELLVHIADVAVAVPPESPLDLAVRARASSLFLPDRSVLMFPPELVEGRLSLATGEVREALTGVFRIAPDGRVVASRFVRSLVRLTRRVTYEETHDAAALGPDADAGSTLVRLCEALRVARQRRGARVLRLPSTKVAVVDGVPHVGLRLQDAPGDVVVSESMVLHNTLAGELLAGAGAPALFRGQSADAPTGRIAPEPGDPLYAARIRRTFAPTETSVEPVPHAGLGAPAYVQSTSPIRRYADLVNQRQIAAVAHGDSPPHSAEELAGLQPVLHARERAVRQAADARTQYWVARAIERSGRETLLGVLSKTPRRGLGSVWVPELCKELPLRAPKGWRAPAEGTELEWRIAAVKPYRGRIELAPL